MCGDDPSAKTLQGSGRPLCAERQGRGGRTSRSAGAASLIQLWQGVETPAVASQPAEGDGRYQAGRLWGLVPPSATLRSATLRGVWGLPGCMGRGVSPVYGDRPTSANIYLNDIYRWHFGEPLDFALPTRKDDEIDRRPSYLAAFWPLASERYVEIREDRLDRPERRRRERRDIHLPTDIRVVTLRRPASPLRRHPPHSCACTSSTLTDPRSDSDHGPSSAVRPLRRSRRPLPPHLARRRSLAP
jgi:hypothetical protein